MKRYILAPMLLLAFLWALLLPGCNRPTPSAPSSTPSTTLPQTTATPTDPTEPNPLVTVHLLAGYVCEGKETAFVYDDAGRLLEVSIDGAVVVTRTYDTQGNCLAYKNTLRGIDQTYDAQGRILTNRTEEGLTTNTYDEAGRCISVEHQSPDGTLLSITRCTYDEAGRCLSVEHQSPDGTLLSATRYAYDEQGNLLSEILEQNGSVHHEILHTYDENGLHLTATYCRDGKLSAEGPSYTWRYDSLGHLEHESIYYGEEFFQGTLFYYIVEADQTLAYMQWDSSGRFSEYSHNFDLNGNLTFYEETTRDAEGNSYTISFLYGYDDHGNTVSLEEVDRLGQKYTYLWTYDESGTAMTGHSLTSPSESYEYTWTYDDNGRQQTETRTGDAPHEIIWIYGRQGKVVSIVRTGTAPQEIAYAYDEQGNLIQESITVESVTTVTDYTYTTLSVMPEVAAQLLAQQAELFRLLNGEAD